MNGFFSDPFTFSNIGSFAGLPTLFIVVRCCNQGPHLFQCNDMEIKVYKQEAKKTK